MKFKESHHHSMYHYYLAHFKNLNGGYDDFFEDHLLKGTPYEIFEDETSVGVFVVSEKFQLMLIHLNDNYRKDYEVIFHQILHFGHVQGILGVSNDSQLMMQILKHNFNIIKQAYNFDYLGKEINQKLTMKLATKDDIPTMEKLFGDFFTDYAAKVLNHELYLGLDGDTIVSLGNITHHQIDQKKVSIGMIVAEKYRQQGYGTMTIQGMINIGLQRQCHVYAGCWYYNHASKKTLMNAGMTPVNFIIRVDHF